MVHGLIAALMIFWQGLLSTAGMGVPDGSAASVPSGAEQTQWSMKLVNETVSDEELTQIQNLGITTVSGEWGMEEIEAPALIQLLDRLDAHHLQLVVNFSDGAAWGYAEDGSDLPEQQPTWQSEKVQHYVQKIKNHPGVWGYDVSNEAGENLPHGDRFRITAVQLQQAAQDIREVDDTHPLLLRMHYWDQEDGDFTWENPFPAGVVDVVMLNLYSNYTENGRTPVLPHMIEESGQRLIDTVRTKDPYVRIWIALAAFEEAPYFLRPSVTALRRDLTAASALRHVENIGFFGWGPERYPQQGRGWSLPRDGAALVAPIRSFTLSVQP